MLTLSEGWDSSGRGLRCLLLSESGIAFVVTCSKRRVDGSLAYIPCPNCCCTRLAGSLGREPLRECGSTR